MIHVDSDAVDAATINRIAIVFIFLVAEIVAEAKDQQVQFNRSLKRSIPISILFFFYAHWESDCIVCVAFTVQHKYFHNVKRVTILCTAATIFQCPKMFHAIFISFIRRQIKCCTNSWRNAIEIIIKHIYIQIGVDLAMHKKKRQRFRLTWTNGNGRKIPYSCFEKHWQPQHWRQSERTHGREWEGESERASERLNERRDVFAFAKHDTMHNHILTDWLPDRATIDCIRKTFHLVNGYALPSATFQW